MALTNEQKRSISRLINAIALIIFLIGIFTNLYDTTTGLIIALIIWILQKPVLTLLRLNSIPEHMSAEQSNHHVHNKERVSGWRVVAIIALILLVLTWLSSAVSGQSWWFGRGSGTLTTEDRSVSDFSKVELSGSGILNITQGDNEVLSIEAEDNLMDRIESRVSNGTLHLGFKSPWFFIGFWPTRDITYNLSVKDLERIGVSGSGTITSDSLTTDRLTINISGSGKATMTVQVDELDVDVSGSGEFDLRGQATSQTVNINGSGKYLAKNLRSTSADFSVSGSGQGIVNASDRLKVSISGSGKIEYVGSPSITQNISGSGNVSQYTGTVDTPAGAEESTPDANQNTNTSVAE